MSDWLTDLREISQLLARAKARGVRLRPCSCEPCSRTSIPCTAVLSDLQADLAAQTDPRTVAVILAYTRTLAEPIRRGIA